MLNYRKPAADNYTSSLRIEPLGPNSDLRKGPNSANHIGPIVSKFFFDKNENNKGQHFRGSKMKITTQHLIYLRKVTIYLLTSCNTEERIAQNIYIHNPNRKYKKLTTTTILIKNRIGIGYKNYGKKCPGLEFRLIPKLISWVGLKPKKIINIVVVVNFL